MRILFLTPGSGDTFYCENCLRDKAVVVALRKMGHDAMSVPLYLPPLARDTDSGSGTPVFFGGVNVYLQQKFALFRRTPRWLDRLWDGRWLLKRLAKKAGATSPADLGELTVSMLAGQDGRQGKELDRLVKFLVETGRPEAVVLSNALLLGLAPRIKRDLGVPVVCMLQDEHELADELREPYRSQAWGLMSQRIREVDAVVAASRYYAGWMARRLGLAVEGIHVIHNGVDAEGYQPRQTPPPQPAIGYLTRMHESFGLDLLAEGFIRLRAEGRDRGARLVLAGGMTGADRGFVKGVRRRLDRAGLAGQVDWPEDFDRGDKRAMLPGWTVMCVPGRGEAAAGMCVLESLAAGVPVVAPACGVYPELVEATGGGMLFEPGDVGDMTAKLAWMLGEPEGARRMGMRGREVALREYSAEAAAGKLMRVVRGGRGER